MKRNDIVQAIELLTELQRVNGTPWLPEMEAAKTKALNLLEQFDRGDYIEVTPTLNGYGYETTYHADPHAKPERLGHDSPYQVADYALTLDKPVVISSDWGRPWREHVERRLTGCKVTVIVDEW